ncbi:MAG: insulinase family protein [Alphaproteobacteria bacterium]|nr:insulinase family protein [Alphaproteobacteria bacterium]
MARQTLPSVPLRACLLAIVAAVGLAASARAAHVERVVSPGGIEAWLVVDRSNPILAMEALFRGGSALDPVGKEGLADMATSLLDEGAGPYDASAFQQRLEDRSIQLGFGASRDGLSVTLRTLTRQRDEAVAMLRLALTEPRFDAAAVERVRSQKVAGLRRSAEEPNTIAGRTWVWAAFPDHAYGRPSQGTLASVGRVTADDMRAFVRQRFVRAGMAIGVVGDIDAAALAPLLDQAFGALPREGASPDVPRTTPSAQGRLLVVEKDIPQSRALFGHAGIARDDPDWYAALVVNHVLGGSGLNSRLAHEIREKRGLAYGVSTGLSPLEGAPIIQGSVATANERIAESIDLIRQEWRRMRDEGPTESEIADAKTYLVGSFPLQLATTRGLASTLVSMQRYALGIGHIQERAALIERVSAADVRRVARRLLIPDELFIVVVGKPSGLQGAERVSPPDG